ncbi:ATP-binding cassette domain-containing protein [Bacillaceae bacterium SIJ1]|uniref:ATP-binding cassette domain-containing protein n=1 Tax=Litoribacterium kuwaitense TaxID=1398745 RepID=UPI0013ED11AD|nr:ATP-binding cassette domain-containing protein [Litoribacterium kuwaitense]NGP46459.1 ATP-binding cassette domain-containing protein [Litoribacterium kuwaitense]
MGSLEKPTIEDVKEASRQAGANDFIDGLENQYETVIREQGSSLSGGQRQRIALARAFIRNAPLVILDEVTSALDNESEKRVVNAIQKLIKRGTTVLMITHNLSLAQKADRIIVMDQGHVAEDGNHESLIRLNGIYAELSKEGK